MQIAWYGVNRTEKPGLHLVVRLGLDILITEGAIARWKADPECHHRVVHISTVRGNLHSLRPCEPFQKH